MPIPFMAYPFSLASLRMSRLLVVPVDVDDQGQGRGHEADLDDDVGDDQGLGRQDAALGEAGREEEQADALADDLDADEELDEVALEQEADRARPGRGPAAKNR